MGAGFPSPVCGRRTMQPSAWFGGRAVEPGSLVCMTDRSRPGAALILAAGEGTRMRSAVPKVLHSIGGRSLLGHAVHAVAELDPEHLVVVLGHGGDQVREAVTAFGEELARPVTVAVQEQQLGTGHAVGRGLDALPHGITGP